MKYSFAIVALAVAALAEPIPQGVTSAISPPVAAPPGCSPSSPSSFEITVIKATSTKRSVEERQESGTLVLKLLNGVLTDQVGRTGYIAANYQFQFDAPPQTGAIYTSGFSLCSNGSLALGGSAIFYECLSGSFYNLYDRRWAAQCSPINIVAMPNGAATQPATPVTQITDGQPQGPSPAPVSEKSEGQPVATTSAAAVSEKSEGQPVATTSAPAVSEKSEGQPVATTSAAAVSEKSEGQPVVTSSAAAVSEKSEGQPVVTSSAPAVSEKSEGQPVVTSATPTVSAQSGSQPVVTSAPATSSSVAPTATPSLFTGAAATPVYQAGALAAGILGMFALL